MLLVVAVLLAVTILLTWPLATHFWSGYVGGNTDTLLNTWIITWDARAIFSHPTGIFQGNIMYPCRDVLAYSEHLFAMGLLAAPIYFITGNPTFSYNCILFLGFVLSGLGCYILIKELTGSRWAALAGGLFFAFCPFKVAKVGYIHVIFSAFLPFMIIHLRRYLERGGGRSLALFGVFFLAQALSSWHYLLFSTISVLLYCAWSAAFARKKQDLLRLSAVIGVMILAALAMLPFALPYLRANARLPGFQRTLEDARTNSAGLKDYLNVLPQNFVYRYMPFTRLSYVSSELCFFPGLVTLALAAFAFLFAIKEAGSRMFSIPRRRDVFFFLLLLLVGIILAAGPEFAGITNLPYVLLYHTGFLKIIRVPSRFYILTAFGLSVLAGYGLAGINSRLAGAGEGAGSSWRLRLFSALVILMLLMDLFVFGLSVFSPGREVPEVYTWLREQGDVKIIELPTDYTDRPRQALFMYYSTVHWKKTVNGYSGYHPLFSRVIFSEMRGFPSRDSLDLLRGLDIDYVIWHREFLDDAGAAAFDERVREQGGLLEERDFGEQQVFRVLPAETARVSDLETALTGDGVESGEGGGSLRLLVSNRSEAAFVAVDEEPQRFILRCYDRSGSPLAEVEGDYRAPFFIKGGTSISLPLCQELPCHDRANTIEVELTSGVLEGRVISLELSPQTGTH